MIRKVIAVRAEVYSRVVGYYRPVQDWNRGKQEEYHDRYQHEAARIAKHVEEPETIHRSGALDTVATTY